jgi:RNA polymerase sigma-32 factor
MQMPADSDMHRSTLNPQEVDAVAKQLKVKPEEVLEMEMRMSGGDVMLDPAHPTTKVKRLLALLLT